MDFRITLVARARDEDFRDITQTEMVESILASGRDNGVVRACEHEEQPFIVPKSRHSRLLGRHPVESSQDNMLRLLPVRRFIHARRIKTRAVESGQDRFVGVSKSESHGKKGNDHAMKTPCHMPPGKGHGKRWERK